MNPKESEKEQNESENEIEDGSDSDLDECKRNREEVRHEQLVRLE